LKPLLHCATCARTVLVGLAGCALVPAVLWSAATIGVLALSAALAAGVRLPQAAVVLAFAGAALSTCACLLTARERQPDEASLWAAAALWLALFAAAVFDLSDLARGPHEADLVWGVAIAFFFALWLPYLRRRWAVLPHAAEWTLAAAAALPSVLAWRFASELRALHAAAPLGFAVLATAAGFVAARAASRRLPPSASAVVAVAAALLLVPAWVEVLPDSILAFAPHVAGAAGMAVLLSMDRSAWHALRGERGPALIPAAAGFALLFAWSSDAFVLLACVGGAIAVGAWWMLVVRRLGRDAAAQRAAAQAALARIRSGAVAGGMLATVVLCGFLLTGLAWNPPSAQMLAWLRAAGVPDIDESDIVRALYEDEYLWRDLAVDRSKPPAERTSPLDWWTRPEIDRYSWAHFGSQRAWLDRDEAVGTGLLVAFEGRTATVVFAPEGSPAHALGIRRGDRLLLKREDRPDAEEAPRKRRRVTTIDYPLETVVASRDGAERTVKLEARTLRERRVIRTATLDAGGQVVGYVALLGFDPAGEREFVEAIAALRAEGVRALVVDLRYNPGGRLDSAAGIAGAILGAGGRGRVFATTHHNARHRDRDRAYPFRVPAAGGLAPDQIVVITSGASCSASELLVKGLEPYAPVATVGATTCGKPVGSSVFESGEWTYALISFAVRNAHGEGGYFDGLAPICNAPDDVTRELGDPAEASLREALRYIATGRCSPDPVRATGESSVVL
jgi:hypothetical protein